MFSLLITTMIFSIFTKDIKKTAIINIISSVINVAVVIYLMFRINSIGFLSYMNNSIYIDSLSIIQMFVGSGVTFITAIYSYRYVLNELRDEIISERRARVFFTLFNAFVISLLIICISNNIMGMWIGLEGTTIATTFLIGLEKNKLSLEAAWKYVILCSIGIGIGFIGIILMLYSAGQETTVLSLNWTNLLNSYKPINIDMAKIAFTLIFIGIGTKAGFVPMHAWFSDGHSEAPSPVSAMVSGILLNIALYVIVRFYIIIKMVSGIENVKYLFIIFAMISLLVSAFTMLKQTNYKRLLAFSSIENMGIISLGIGFGGHLGIFGGLLHSIIHSFGKTLLFLVAGNLVSVYRTKRIDKIHKLIKTMPMNGVFLILGMLIVTGAPPFGSFFSEFNILMEGINKGYYFAVTLYALCILIAFAALLNVFIRMIFVKGDEEEYKRFDKDSENIVPVIISLIYVVFVTLTFNNILYPILSKAVLIIGI
ncbi:proton-conducting transporter membrane subunit [Fervidicella metallireducens]|nr:proton-conducting transporter membrane subunit [Fervidicella metallireducens]